MLFYLLKSICLLSLPLFFFPFYSSSLYDISSVFAVRIAAVPVGRKVVEVLYTVAFGYVAFGPV